VNQALAEVLHVPAQYSTIQAAVSAAVDGDEVRVAPGTYTGGGNKNIDLHGKDLRVLGEGGPEATIIDCQWDGRAFNLEHGEPSTATLCPARQVPGRTARAPGCV
jgi:hypothetical protein